MSAAKHTAGPWEVHQGDDYLAVGNYAPSPYKAIITIKYPGEEDQANALLIAAAPDLLEALEAIKARLNGEFDNPALLKFGPLGTTEADCYQIAVFAIAHAKGAV